MKKTAADIAQKRGKELFLVETVSTPSGKRYAVVSHREKIGQDKRFILAKDEQDGFYPYTKDGREKAAGIAKTYREAAKK